MSDASRAYVARSVTYMGPAAMDAPRCLGTKRCKPLGGQSVWATLAPLRVRAGCNDLRCTEALRRRLERSAPDPPRPRHTTCACHSQPSPSVVVYATPMDTPGLFHETSPGVASAAPGLIVAVAAAFALAEVRASASWADARARACGVLGSASTKCVH